MKKIFLLLSTILLFACKDNILLLDVNDYLKDRKPIPVVYCLFTNDSTFKVISFLNYSVFDSTENTEIKAKIYIVDQYNDTIFCYKKNDRLFESNEVAKKGVKYYLFVETDKYGILRASSYVPQNTVFFDTTKTKINFSEYNLFLNSNFNLYFSDTKSKNKYYSLMALYKHIYFYPLDSMPYDTSYTHFSISSDCKERSDNLLLNYNNQNLSIYTLSFFCGIAKNELKKPNQFIITLRQITPEYYYFYYSFKKYQENHIDYFTILMTMSFSSANQIYTNIENGQGIFAGYNEDAQIVISLQ